MGKRTRSNRWAGWSKLQPRGSQRRTMRKKCGRKCFVGPRSEPTSFPICAVYGNKITCDPNDKGLWAAYIRARQMSSRRTKNRRHSRKAYERVANRARRKLRDRGQWVGGSGLGYSNV